jgi:hypothetical protein
MVYIHIILVCKKKSKVQQRVAANGTRPARLPPQMVDVGCVSTFQGLSQLVTSFHDLRRPQPQPHIVASAYKNRHSEDSTASGNQTLHDNPV